MSIRSMMSEEKLKMLKEIREKDHESTNGGHYLGPDRRDIAEELVDDGVIVRMKNPAGVSPQYFPMDSPHFTDERLKTLRNRQME